MDSGIKVFGAELRRRRIAAGLSLAGLAGLVHYSRSHLSKVETGAKPPSVDLARRCDRALSCDGELAALVPGPETALLPAVGVDSGSDSDSDSDWALIADQSGAGAHRTGLSRRYLLAAGGVAGLGLGAAPRWLSAPGDRSRAECGPETLAAFRGIFDQLRVLGQTVSPVLLVPNLMMQTRMLLALARAGGTSQHAAFALAARFAEFTGWMLQEAGDDERAAQWTDQAVSFAQFGGESDMAAYALVRRGLIALYRQDSAQTVELAREAQRRTDDPRIRGLAAQREAQGLAVAGDYDGCHRALDRAAGLLAAPPREDSSPALGSANVNDPVAMATGWCLFDLGDTARAAEVLRGECARIPDSAYRARARFGARLALALAASGEPEEAVRVAQAVLDQCDRVDSATVRVDLRLLARELNRWRTKPDVQATNLRIVQELSVRAA